MPKIKPTDVYIPKVKAIFKLFDSVVFLIQRSKKVSLRCHKIMTLHSNANILDVHKIRRFRSMGLHFIHFGMLQVGIRPLTRKDLNTSALVCALDTRHHSFKDALLGAVQAPLHDGPIYFNVYPNFTCSLSDPHLNRSLRLKIKTHGFNMLEGSLAPLSSCGGYVLRCSTP